MTQYVSRITFFYENRYSAFSALPEIHSNFFDKPLCRATTKGWFRKLEDGICDAPSKSLQMRMGSEVVEEFVDVLGQSLN